MKSKGSPGHNNAPPPFAGRRARVLDRLGPRDALLLPPAPPLRSGRDRTHRYVVDPDLYYLTGIDEPEVFALLRGGPHASLVLFVPTRNADEERWTGPRRDASELQRACVADEAHDARDLEHRLPGLLSGVDTLFVRPTSCSADLWRLLRDVAAAGTAARQRTGAGTSRIADAGLLLDPLRLRKDDHEIACIREACRITCESFRDASEMIDSGVGEWEVESAVEAGFRSRGAQGVAFQTIVGAGANATILHYTRNADRLRAGDLVLIDAGAQIGGYTADVSRTWPVAHAMTDAQRALFDVVGRAHAAGVAAAIPGRPAADVHDASLRAIVHGLTEMGVLAGDVDDLLAAPETYRAFFPHRAFHWLGLEVHDVGDYVMSDGAPRRLEPGMVLTVEPGIYIPCDETRAPEALRGAGIRIEDDVLVTPEGPEVLTSMLPHERASGAAPASAPE